MEYAVRYGDMSEDPSKLRKIVADIVPEAKLQSVNWAVEIKKEFKNLSDTHQAFQGVQLNRDSIGAQIVRQCSQIWTMQFSRFYSVIPHSFCSKFYKILKLIMYFISVIAVS